MTGQAPSFRRPPLTEVVGRKLDRRIGRLRGELGRVASTVHHTAIVALTVTLTYVAFFLTYDPSAFGWLVAINLVAGLAYGATVLLARLGRQLPASLVLFVTATAQIAWVTDFVGWQAGFHLFFLVGAPLAVVAFRDRQATARWVLAAAAPALVVAVSLLLPAGRAKVQLPAELLNSLCAINAVLVAAMLWGVAVLSDFRAQQEVRAATQLSATIEQLTTTDSLTGLAPRDTVVEHLAVLAQSGGAPYCVAIADLDHFNEINHVFGFDCGDRVLAEVGSRFRTGLRATDAVGRWGGEEFVFVMPQAHTADAVVTMERVRGTVSDVAVECTDHVHDITVSIGLSPGYPDDAPHHVVTRAERALILAKNAGRNRVEAIDGDSDVTQARGTGA